MCVSWFCGICVVSWWGLFVIIVDDVVSSFVVCYVCLSVLLFIVTPLALLCCGRCDIVVFYCW